MASEENVKEFKVKTIKDLELMAKKLKRKIGELEKLPVSDSLYTESAARAMVILVSEYRLIKREIMDTISI